MLPRKTRTKLCPHQFESVTSPQAHPTQSSIKGHERQDQPNNGMQHAKHEDPKQRANKNLKLPSKLTARFCVAHKSDRARKSKPAFLAVPTSRELRSQGGCRSEGIGVQQIGLVLGARQKGLEREHSEECNRQGGRQAEIVMTISNRAETRQPSMGLRCST